MLVNFGTHSLMRQKASCRFLSFCNFVLVGLEITTSNFCIWGRIALHNYHPLLFYCVYPLKNITCMISIVFSVLARMYLRCQLTWKHQTQMHFRLNMMPHAQVRATKNRSSKIYFISLCCHFKFCPVVTDIRVL